MDTSQKYIKMCERAEEIQKIYQQVLNRNRRRYTCFNSSGYCFYRHHDTIIEEARIDLKGWVVARVKQEYTFEIQFHCIDDVLNWKDSLKECIWLPRQDQLQKIIFINEIEELCIDFNNWCGWFTQRKREYAKLFTSMEQLWLAYVMFVKSNKIWNSEKEEWIKP